MSLTHSGSSLGKAPSERRSKEKICVLETMLVPFTLGPANFSEVVHLQLLRVRDLLS